MYSMHENNLLRAHFIYLVTSKSNEVENMYLQKQDILTAAMT